MAPAAGGAGSGGHQSFGHGRRLAGPAAPQRSGKTTILLCTSLIHDSSAGESSLTARRSFKKTAVPRGRHPPHPPREKWLYLPGPQSHPFPDGPVTFSAFFEPGRGQGRGSTCHRKRSPLRMLLQAFSYMQSQDFRNTKVPRYSFKIHNSQKPVIFLTK